MKKVIKINNKNYTIPSFFWISNLGGGGSDKYREKVGGQAVLGRQTK